MPVQKGWKVNVNRCFGCRACELACKTEYHLAAGEGRRRRVTEITALDDVSVDSPLDQGPLAGAQHQQVRTYFLSMACNQCAEPPCVEACPKNALKKTNTVDEFTDYLAVCGVDQACIDEFLLPGGDPSLYDRIKGVVLHCRDLCIGCRRCEACCPYGAPQYNRTCRKIHKCELCWQRVVNIGDVLPADRAVPACVAQCGGSVAQRGHADPTLAELCHGPTLEMVDVDTDAASEGYADEAGGASVYHRPGELPDTLNHGSKDLAPAILSKPALKVRNREYILRNGGVRK